MVTVEEQLSGWLKWLKDAAKNGKNEPGAKVSGLDTRRFWTLTRRRLSAMEN